MQIKRQIITDVLSSASQSSIVWMRTKKSQQRSCKRDQKKDRKKKLDVILHKFAYKHKFILEIQTINIEQSISLHS